ncbi:MAG: (d)CMP kinase [Firmicutes bacterium]|nr:(d)CMP kinase [Alicyclobacillaceae bacterium]MCL6496772.1 (d)CMP kinase [Bacillota bacterium]
MSPLHPKRQLVIAVDGPAGAGKSTVARRVADRLGLEYLDTGAMYRALALKALRRGVDLRDEEQLAELLATSDIAVASRAGGAVRVFLDGEDVSDAIRAPEVNAAVSQVAGFAKVRAGMVTRQRALARAGGVVVDGRDIGTEVLPDADVKFFLTASLKARARRRWEELRAQGFSIELDAVEEEIAHRDRLDAGRAVGPLRRAPDAILIDTTDVAVDAVVEELLRFCRLRVCE